MPCTVNYPFAVRCPRRVGRRSTATGLPVLANIVVGGVEASAKWRLDRLQPDGAGRPSSRITTKYPSSPDVRRFIVVGRGDQIVLAGELVDGEIEVDESLLTGEADPVIRRQGQTLLSGSVCVSGSGVMRVARVGLESYASQLTAEAQSLRTERTPLQQGVDRLIAMSTVLVVLVSLAVAYTSTLGVRETPVEVAQSAAVLVRWCPRLDPDHATCDGAPGSASALVRVNSVESMSRVDTLVLDKTGTITAPHWRASFRSIDQATSCASSRRRRRCASRVGYALRQWACRQPAA
jgi:cation-transporting ATPase E